MAQLGQHQRPSIDLLTLAGSSFQTTQTSGSDAQGDDGPALFATLNSPGAIAVSPSGLVYIAATYGNAVYVVNVTTGIMTLFAGNASASWSDIYGKSTNSSLLGDNGPATKALLVQPAALAFSPSGDTVYIADSGAVDPALIHLFVVSLIKRNHALVLCLSNLKYHRLSPLSKRLSSPIQ